MKSWLRGRAHETLGHRGKSITADSVAREIDGYRARTNSCHGPLPRFSKLPGNASHTFCHAQAHGASEREPLSIELAGPTRWRPDFRRLRATRIRASMRGRRADPRDLLHRLVVKVQNPFGEASIHHTHRRQSKSATGAFKQRRVQSFLQNLDLGGHRRLRAFAISRRMLETIHPYDLKECRQLLQTDSAPGSRLHFGLHRVVYFSARGLLLRPEERDQPERHRGLVVGHHESRAAIEVRLVGHVAPDL
jgi:hypothetical protein